MTLSTRRVPAWLTMQPIAHRGLHTMPRAPENSLPAFEAAAVAGFPIEIDVRLLADGQVAVFHDSDLERLTGASGALEDRTAPEIRALRLLGTGEHIPLLSETLDVVAGRVPLLVEIKSLPSNNGPLVRATIEALSDYTGPIAIQSFSPETLAFLAAQAPQIIRGQLAADDRWRAEADEPETLASPDFLAYKLQALPTPFSSQWRAQGLPLLAWTIQTHDELHRARAIADNYIFETILPK